MLAALLAALCWLFYLFTSEPYLYTDNVGVAVVLNGFYASPLSQYQHPFFCLLVGALAKVFPSADLYTTVVHLLIFAELCVIMILLPQRTLKKQIRNWQLADILLVMVSLLFCVFISAGLNLWRANYTITAASFLFTGWIVLVNSRNRRSHPGWNIIGIGFIAFGYMLRKEAGLLFLPFISLVLFAELLISQRTGQTHRDILRRYCPALAVLVLLITSQAAYQSIEPYATAKRYNDARTAMVDFPVRTWSENDAALAGTQKEDYIAATNWFFSDTEVMNTDLLCEMAEKCSRNEYSFSVNGFQKATSRMYGIAAKTDVYMTVMVILCLMLAFWNGVSQKSGWMRLIAVSGVIGAIIILFYFTFRGRAPLRVWQPALFGVLYLETALIMIGEKRVCHTAQTIFLLLTVAVLYYSAGQVIAHTEFHSPRMVLTARENVDDSAYEQTFRGDDLYIWPNWHAEIPKHFGEMGKLPTRRVLEHNIALGDWTSGQPYYTEFLTQIGHPNPMRDLVEKPNVYIMSNSAYILDFLRLHYSEKIDLAEAGQINNVTAYRVTTRK